MLDFQSLVIYPECRYRKILEAGTYSFGSIPIDDFYGRNVTLHAIVGRNGSGKSSLLDIIMRIINNVGALICRREKRDASDRLRYVCHIYADLAFTTTFVIKGDLLSESESDVIHNCKICTRDRCLWIEYDSEVYWMSDEGLMGMAFRDNKICNELMTKYGDNFHDYSDMRPEEKKHDIAIKLFYTVATNYSMLGFQSADYADEDSLEYEEVNLSDEEGHIFVDANGRHLVTEEWVKKKNWITGLFHKNDGYMCPIVLNPYRDGGIINMNNEASLTISRLSALLVMYMQEQNVIDDYQLDHISYSLKEDFYLKFKPIVGKDDSEKKNQLANGGDLRIFSSVAQKEKSWSWTVLDELGIPIQPNLHKTEIAARLYVAYKILNIAATYPHYAKYRKYGKIDKVFDGYKQVPAPNQFRKLIQEIEGRKTHVEQKVHQVLRFIRKMDEYRGAEAGLDTTWLDSSFIYDDYISHIPISHTFNNLDDCMRSMPPNIFRQTIYLKKVVDGKVVASGIPFNKMSSGQKQILYQLSALIYHLVNLKSVPQDEIRYHNVNIILDEIEVCFHPEYQRMFISRLLDLLCNKLQLNTVFGIHFWLTTHSPFILSDIPEGRITYLKQGHPMSEEDKRVDGIMPPMAANISDLLHQSFFLEHGFVGEFVRQKIKNLVSFLNGSQQSDEWSESSVREFISNICEPYISYQLKRMYKKYYEKDFN